MLKSYYKLSVNYNRMLNIFIQITSFTKLQQPRVHQITIIQYVNIILIIQKQFQHNLRPSDKQKRIDGPGNAYICKSVVSCIGYITHTKNSSMNYQTFDHSQKECALYSLYYKRRHISSPLRSYLLPSHSHCLL